jgi:uncharacterized protein
MREWIVTKIHKDLPVFLIEGYNILYIPGYICRVSSSDAEEIKNFFASPESNVSKRVKNLASKLTEYALKVQETWKKKLYSPFEPVCLTLYLSNRCNLKCSYCYTGKVSKNSYSIDEKAVIGAAEFVLNVCRKKNHPFLFVLNGGGEPSVQWEQVVRLEDITRKTAEKFNVEWHGTIITNGVMQEEHVIWLCKHFNHIAMSCDGPPFIQDRQRPLKNGELSSPYVERTAEIINRLGVSMSVRATITPDTVEYQSHIVEYLYEKLSAINMRFEPVYEVWNRNKSPFKNKDASQFAEHFISAQKKAEKLGCNLTCSGVRLNELHRSYCSMFRNVLHLVPPDGISGCFFCTDSSVRPELLTGNFYKGEIKINQELIDFYRHKPLPKKCSSCINIYHCSGECPEICSVTENNETEGFLCLVQKELALRWILEMAGHNNGTIYNSI